MLYVVGVLVGSICVHGVWEFSNLGGSIGESFLITTVDNFCNMDGDWILPVDNSLVNFPAKVRKFS